MATLAGKTLEGSVARGCLQQDVLLSLLCSLDVDKFMDGLSEKGCYTMGYAVDTTILNSGNFLQIVSELLQEVLSVLQQWCETTHLPINPQKKGDISIYKEEKFKGPKGTNPLWS
jgi:hypothetical protein